MAASASSGTDTGAGAGLETASETGSEVVQVLGLGQAAGCGGSAGSGSVRSLSLPFPDGGLGCPLCPWACVCRSSWLVSLMAPSSDTGGSYATNMTLMSLVSPCRNRYARDAESLILKLRCIVRYTPLGLTYGQWHTCCGGSRSALTKHSAGLPGEHLE